MKAGTAIVDLITLFFIGSIIVLIVTHAPGFSQAAGTVFTGIDSLGNTLTGAGLGKGKNASRTTAFV